MNERQIDRLLVLTARGDNDAFAQLYEETKRGVYSFLYSYLQNRDDTEDALQNTFLKIKLNIDKYAQNTNGRAWILQIAKNVALNEIYARKRLSPLDDELKAADKEISSDVIGVMQKILSDDEQRIMILHVLWGYKHREIANILNCPTGTVTSKYKRSVEKLKSALKEVER